MENANLSGYSLKSFLSKVDLPVPDGPFHRTRRDETRRGETGQSQGKPTRTPSRGEDHLESRTADDDRSDRGSYGGGGAHREVWSRPTLQAIPKLNVEALSVESFATSPRPTELHMRRFGGTNNRIGPAARDREATE